MACDSFRAVWGHAGCSRPRGRGPRPRAPVTRHIPGGAGLSACPPLLFVDGHPRGQRPRAGGSEGGAPPRPPSGGRPSAGALRSPSCVAWSWLGRSAPSFRLCAPQPVPFGSPMSHVTDPLSCGVPRQDPEECRRPVTPPQRRQVWNCGGRWAGRGPASLLLGHLAALRFDPCGRRGVLVTRVSYLFGLKWRITAVWLKQWTHAPHHCGGREVRDQGSGSGQGTGTGQREAAGQCGR